MEGEGRREGGRGGTEKEREQMRENSCWIMHSPFPFTLKHFNSYSKNGTPLFGLQLDSTLHDLSLRRRREITAELPYSNCLSCSHTQIQMRCLSPMLITTGKIWKKDVCLVDKLSVWDTSHSDIQGKNHLQSKWMEKTHSFRQTSFTHSFIHSFHRCSLSTHSKPGMCWVPAIKYWIQKRQPLSTFLISKSRWDYRTDINVWHDFTEIKLVTGSSSTAFYKKEDI